jgi:hypothetical protein
MSKLQKVGDELVTNSGYCSRDPASTLLAHEAAVTEGNSCLEARPNSNRVLIKDK